ncbi:AAA family ATPase [Mesorhizobium sp. B2-1-8]|uniref:ParA family protein n=1 Tax=Mesorhizobium sp. B2-1-8 TaxID=2589967 RepID=UPI00112C848D|nr:ParA family protein [Mesorhizobium sp. B2-1-8]UCI20183.1 AAA family ATPase [Mesorhizobium sp. B2-1-8]
MKVISFFNNKGGVGKTTLTGNICAYLAIEMKKRILVVDADPQCNVTQFILGDEKTINMYWPESEPKYNLRTNTILDVVQPILDGDASVNPSVKFLSSKTNRFGVSLLPGHPRFSLLEDALSAAWTELPSGKPGGFRISNWLRTFLKKCESDFDFVFVDVSPSLGALNRSILLSCNHFISPLGADAFSILGLRNIASWMAGWIKYYEVGLEQSERLNPGSLERYEVPKEIPVRNGYVGYTLQQYIAKAKEGVRRPTKAYERILEDLPDEVRKYMIDFSPEKDLTKLHLGDVPNLYSLIPLAQSSNAPIIALRSKDGLVGSQFLQASEYTDIISRLAKKILEGIDG